MSKADAQREAVERGRGGRAEIQGRLELGSSLFADPESRSRVGIDSHSRFVEPARLIWGVGPAGFSWCSYAFE